MITGIRHEFIDFIPEDLAERTLYISIRFSTATHKCFCGCGSEVVTPLAPTEWSLTFDGETVSLDPPVGNWTLDCQSHYWIRRDTIRWAERWSSAEIREGRARALAAREAYYGRAADREIAAPQEAEGLSLVGWVAGLRARIVRALRG